MGGSTFLGYGCVRERAEKFVLELEKRGIEGTGWRYHLKWRELKKLSLVYGLLRFV